MQENARIFRNENAHFLENARKCNFPENACIFLKMQENARIFTENARKCAHFPENARPNALLHFPENARKCIFTENALK